MNQFGRRLSFFFNAYSDFFEEIGKFRAARRIWAWWMKERYGATDERAMMCRFHTQTAGVSLTAQQPENNIARAAIQALSAALGGTQSLHTDSFDEALASPPRRQHASFRTQQIVAHETGATNVADPLGGAYVEVTDEMERQAEAVFAHLDESATARSSRGSTPGSTTATSSARSPAAYRFERGSTTTADHRGRQRVHRRQRGRRDNLLRIDHSVEELQRKRLEVVKQEATGRRRGIAAAIRTAAADLTVNLMPPIIGREDLRHRGRDQQRRGTCSAPMWNRRSSDGYRIHRHRAADHSQLAKASTATTRHQGRRPHSP